MKSIHTVGVIGAGTMGAALAQKFAMENFNVILADIEMQFVERGLKNIRSTLNEGIEKKVFIPEQVNNILNSINGTDNLNELKKCDLIIEAIFENFDAKKNLFKTLSSLVNVETIIATNTSSFSVNELAQHVSHPERFIGLHYFYHAAKNRLVEIIPGDKTSPETFEVAKVFSMQSGKDAITCKDSYGFVVNRFFVPWLNEAVRLFQEGIAGIATIDDVAMKSLGIGMGPFALMNATGISVAYHAEKTLEVFGKLYHVSDKLKIQSELKEQWKCEGDISDDESVRTIIAERLNGVVFLVCSQLLDEKVCSAIDINRGARVGLRWRKGPVDLMKQLGEQDVKRLVKQIADRYETKMPQSIGETFWEMQYVFLQINNTCAVITINRPEDLNALNETVVKQLDEKFAQAENDTTVKTIFITGAGKAFVAGADISFFVRNIKRHTLNDIEAFTEYGQNVFEKIDKSKKQVVAILNGLTLGGGLELALCADVIFALPKAQMAFPETGIGIYPGLGGTLRSARKIGKGLSKYLIHTGKMISAIEAMEIGLVDAVISIEGMFDFISDEKEIEVKPKGLLNEKWKSIEDLFEKNSLDQIIENNITENGIKKADVEKISKTINRKAPIALHLADKLIDDEGLTDSELNHINEIFSTTDALLGLTSIGKQVVFEGK